MLGIVAGAASAAKPGGPLYAARLFAEMAALPTDPIARADAEVSRLEERLLEVRQASIDGDSGAVQAALAAYAAILSEAEQASDNDAAASAAIGASVAHHVSVLSGLVGTVPASARTALEHALASSTKALDDLGPTGRNGGTGGETGQPANGGPGPVDNGQPARTAQPVKPSATPQPERPAVSPKPDRAAETPQPTRPAKSPNPPKPDGSGGPSGHDDPPNDQ
jgi:outer membrane biosynthesis protein TonB